MAQCGERLGRGVEQVGRLEGGVGRKTVVRRILAGARHQRRTAFDPDDLARPTCEGQREIAQPAEKIADAFVCLRLEKTQGPTYQDRVDLVVHLGKVSGPERHAHAELRQFVGKWCDIRRPEWVGRIRSLGLQPELHLVSFGKLLELDFIFGRWWFENAQHQDIHMAADGQFELRHPITDRQTRDEFSKWQQQLRDARGQHMAFTHVGHEAALAFVKANQYTALLGHMAHRQPGPVPIAPAGTMNRPQHRFRLRLADEAQIVFQDALLDRHLGTHVGVLH